jgi:hypothetical protein
MNGTYSLKTASIYSPGNQKSMAFVEWSGTHGYSLKTFQGRIPLWRDCAITAATLALSVPDGVADVGYWRRFAARCFSDTRMETGM